MNPKSVAFALLLACGLLSSVQSAALKTFIESCEKLTGAELDKSNQMDVLECANGLVKTDVIWYVGLNEKATETFHDIKRALEMARDNSCLGSTAQYQLVECKKGKAVQALKNLVKSDGMEQVRSMCSAFNSAAQAPKYMQLVTKALDSSKIIKDLVKERPAVDVPMTLHVFCEQMAQSS